MVYGILFSHLKNEVEIHAMWMKLENIMPSERSHVGPHCMNSFIKKVLNRQICREKCR